MTHSLCSRTPFSGVCYTIHIVFRLQRRRREWRRLAGIRKGQNQLRWHYLQLLTSQDYRLTLVLSSGKTCWDLSFCIIPIRRRTLPCLHQDLDLFWFKQTRIIWLTSFLGQSRAALQESVHLCQIFYWLSGTSFKRDFEVWLSINHTLPITSK